MRDKICEVLDEFTLEEIALIAELWRDAAKRRGMTLKEYLNSVFGTGRLK